MDNLFTRTEWLLGKESLDILKKSHVAIFGVGGVGSYTIEALARSGIGTFTLIDHDVIAKSNVNRQIHALHSTLGRKKVEVMRERIQDINPEATVYAVASRFLDDGHNWGFSYIVDAVDTVTCKMQIILEAKKFDIPLICAMGAGNRLDPTQIKVSDIFITQGCPLAKVMRNLCRKNNVEKLKVVSSSEPPLIKQQNIGSIAFVPSVAGLIMASEVIKDLIKK